MNHELHVRSDVYGLGATLYNLMMLEPPWHFLATIQDVYSKKLEPNDSNYKQEKEKRRAEVRIAITEEISDYRRRLNDAFQNPNQPTDTRQYFPTILQDNFSKHHIDHHTGQLCAVSYIVHQMLSYDSTARPGCEDIAIYIQNYIFTPKNHQITSRMSGISLSSQSSSGSSGSESPLTPPTFDSETLREGPLPVTIHHSMFIMLYTDTHQVP